MSCAPVRIDVSLAAARLPAGLLLLLLRPARS
jgi:hypothetical protein